MTEQEAIKRGHEMRMKMRKPGDWEVETWNNLGWHYCLSHVSGVAKIHASEFSTPTIYTAYVNKGDECYTSGDHWAGLAGQRDHDSPQEAIDRRICDIGLGVEALVAKFNKVKKALGVIK